MLSCTFLIVTMHYGDFIAQVFFFNPTQCKITVMQTESVLLVVFKIPTLINN